MKPIKRLVLLCLLIPIILIPLSLIFLWLSSVIYPVYLLLLSLPLLTIFPIIMSFVISIHCNKNNINRWLGFLICSICVIASEYLGWLWVYLIFKNAAHPVTFNAYLLFSTLCAIAPCVLYLVSMLFIHLFKKINPKKIEQ